MILHIELNFGWQISINSVLQLWDDNMTLIIYSVVVHCWYVLMIGYVFAVCCCHFVYSYLSVAKNNDVWIPTPDNNVYILILNLR